MATKRISRKTNKPLHLYSWGGQFNKAFDSEHFAGTAKGMASGITGALATGMQTSKIEDTSALEESLKKTVNTQANTNDELMNIWGQYSPQEHVKWRDIRGGSAGQRAMDTIGGMLNGAASGASAGPIGAIAGAGMGLIGGIAGVFGAKRKAKRKARRLNNEIDTTNERNLSNLENKAETLDTQNDMNILQNYMAYGGPIHIKKANRGKFTASANRAGMGVQEYARHILANKEKYSPTLVKRANFARNAAGWKHGDGGNLFAYGGDFTNGVTVINNGGSHEENPMEGVPMGVASDGAPNLVEEGEVKFNNYIFSNRLFATGKLLAAYNLPSSYANHSFADIAERLSKESSERPNDPISKRGLIDSMTKLQQAQEQLRAEKQSNVSSRKFADGGRMTPMNILESEFVPLEAPMDFSLKTSSPVYTYQQKNHPDRGEWLRYAPIIGSGLGVMSDALGWTNKADYTNADKLEHITDNITPIEYNPIGNYLTYKPLDRNYYLNKLGAQANAARRSIINQAGGNKAAAMAGILAADYNAQNGMGNLARQAEEYNQAQKERVEAFNRGTNQFNSEMALKAAMANKAKDELRIKTALAASELRNKEKALASSGRSVNLTNLFDNLGNLGIDIANRHDRNMLIKSGALGNYNYKDLRNAGFSKKEAVEQLRKQGWTDEKLKKAGLIK